MQVINLFLPRVNCRRFASWFADGEPPDLSPTDSQVIAFHVKFTLGFLVDTKLGRENDICPAFKVQRYDHRKVRFEMDKTTSVIHAALRRAVLSLSFVLPTSLLIVRY